MLTMTGIIASTPPAARSHGGTGYWECFTPSTSPPNRRAFHEMLETLRERTGIDFRTSLSSIWDRARAHAPDGVGLSLPPHRRRGIAPRAAPDRTGEFDSIQESRAEMFRTESICADANDFPFPDEPLVIYMFNPLPESGMRGVCANLEQSLRKRPRAIYVLYHNPLLEHVLSEGGALHKVAGTEQWSVFRGSGTDLTYSRLHCFDEEECAPLTERLLTHDSICCSSVGIYAQRTAQAAQHEESLRHSEISRRYAVSPGGHGMVAAQSSGGRIVALPGGSDLRGSRPASERISSAAARFRSRARYRPCDRHLSPGRAAGVRWPNRTTPDAAGASPSTAPCASWP